MSKKSKPDQSLSSAADQIGGNEDLIREILLYLPARSLIRFKSVSKQWRSLITDPQFSRHHTLLRKNPTSFLPSGLFFYNSLSKSQQIESVSFSKTGTKIPSLSHPDPHSAGDSISIVQSCNGLDLFRLITIPDRRIKLYCIRNSTTRQCKLIPLPELSPAESIVDCSLAFDPLKSPHYKIVCVKKVKYNPCQFEIYSSETDDWRTTNVTTNPWRMEFDNGVYWNGAIHWIKDDTIRLECYRFDVEAENLTIMSMPQKPQEGDRAYFRYFGEYNGHLHLVYVRSRAAKRFNVLEMDKVTLKWSVKYRVHINRLLSPFPEVAVKGRNEHFTFEETQYAFSILCVMRGEREEDSALVMTIPGKVISYNFLSKKVEVLSELPSQVVDISHFHYVSAYPFVATLYPL